jgi:hypothetical protein
MAMTILSLAAATLSLSVEGVGYLRFTVEGRTVYARGANLVVANGRLAHESGAPLAPVVTLASMDGVTIEPDGTVRASGRLVGRLVLADLEGEPVRQTEHGLLVFSTRARIGMPGTNGFGLIKTEATPEVVVRGADAPSRAPAQPTPTTVKFAAETTVETEEFTVGQIAEAPAPLRPVVLGKTPPFGVPRVLDRVFIEAKIRQAGHDPSQFRLQIPSRVTVTRAGQSVEHSRFVAAAMAAAAKRGTVEPAGQPALQPMVVPVGTVELVAESVTGSGSEVNVTVAAVIDGERFNARTIKLRTAVAPTAVKTGQTVSVRIQAGGVGVTAKGRVVAVDQRSGVVTVKIETTGAVLSGTVAADGAVEVKP